MVEGTPPGDALPPSPQRATYARKGARCGAVAGSPCPHRPHPGHTGHGTPATRSRGRAAGGGTAPDTRCPSPWWKAPPPGTPFRQPHIEQRRPTRAHAVGPVLGPEACTDRIRDKRVAEPWLPAPEDGRPGEGQRLIPDAPHNGGRPPPPGTAPNHPRGTQPPQGMQAKGTVFGPQTHTPAPTARGWRTPTARPVGGQSGEGQSLTSDAPHHGGRRPPPGTFFRHPHSEQRRPARAHASGPVLGPHARTDRTRDTRVAEPWLPAPEDGRPGKGQRLTPGAPHNGGRPPPPPGDAPPPPPRHAAPTGHAGHGDTVGPPHPHTRAHSKWVADPNTLPSGRAVGGGTAPDLRRPSQWWKAAPPGDALPPPPQRATQAGKGARCGAGAGSPRPHRPHPGHTGCGTRATRSRGQAAGGGTAPDTRRPSPWWKAPLTGTRFRHPHSEQRWPARAHAVGPVLGPHAPTDRTRDTRVAEPWLPAPEDGRQGEGQRLTPDAPHNASRPPPPGTAPQHPCGTQPPQGMQAKGTVLGPHTNTPAPTASGWRTPTARPVGGQSGEGQCPSLRRPSQWWKAAPPGDALPPTPQRATPARDGARCGAGAGSPRPHRPHPGHTGRGTLAARSRGRAAGGGTAPDTRRPSQRRQATPPGDGPPPPPRHAAPTGHAG